MTRDRIKISKRRIHCRGTSLVEMVVVLTIAAILLGLAASTIHLLLAAEREATKSSRYAASVARLTRSFRHDLHSAMRVELPPVEPSKPAILIASFPEGRDIRYELDQHLATRIESDSGGMPHRDVFYFAPHSQMRFERVEEEGLVRLEIEMAAGPSGARRKDATAARQPIQTLVIEAAPSRFHRFEANTREPVAK